MSYKPNYRYIPPVHWHWLTRWYDLLVTLAGAGRRLQQRVFELTEIRPDHTVLDVGCGTGSFLELVSKESPPAKLVGVDPDPQSLEIAQGRLADHRNTATLQCAFAEKLPVENESVDVCVSALTFHHMPDHAKRQTATELYRVLKPGGQLVVADFGKTSSPLLKKLMFFERTEYINGNFNGVVVDSLLVAGFTDAVVAKRQFPAIDFVVARKAT